MINSRRVKKRDTRRKGKQKMTQVKVCHLCGDRGFSNALLDCSECSYTVVHQYCLGIPPGSIDASFDWVCENCSEPAECQPCISMTPGDASTKRSEEACDVLNGVKAKMKYVDSLYSKSFTHKTKRNKQKRKRNKQKRKRASFILETKTLVTLGSQCKKNCVKRLKDQSLSTSKVDDMSKDCTTNMPAKVKARAKSGFSSKITEHTADIRKIRKGKRQPECAPVGETPNDQDNMEIVLVEEQPEPILTLMPMEYEGNSEQAKTSYGSLMTKSRFMGHLLQCSNEPEEPVSSVMDCPREIMSGLILLVSPLGEIYVECASFTDDPCLASLTTSILDYISSDGLVVNKHEQRAQSCSIEETVVLEESSLRTDEVGCCSDMHDLVQQTSEVSKADAPTEDQPHQSQVVTKQPQKCLSWEEMLRLKHENLAQLQEEIVELEGELESTKKHGKELKSDLDNIRSFCSRFNDGSQADGLV